MTLNDETIRLVCALERYIGSECFNPKSFNGYTMVEGLEYRYPLTITVERDDGSDYSYSTKCLDPNLHSVTKKTVETMKYKFGANHLYVGQAIVRLLTALEERYGINFEELECKYQSSEQY